jgi:hypothetical protein
MIVTKVLIYSFFYQNDAPVWMCDVATYNLDWNLEMNSVFNTLSDS